MTVRLNTGNGLSPRMDIHNWWRNFIDQRGDGWDSYADIDAELSKYNARFIRYVDNTPDQLEFKSEADIPESKTNADGSTTLYG